RDFISILKVHPNARQFDTQWNLILLEDISWPDTGKHQQLRRIECTSGENHFTRRVQTSQLACFLTRPHMRAIETLAFQIFNADSSITIIKQHARGEGVELHAQTVRILT